MWADYQVPPSPALASEVALPFTHFLLQLGVTVTAPEVGWGVVGGLAAAGPPPPRKLKTLGQPRVAGWGRHKEGLCVARLGCPQDSGGGGRSRFPSRSASCGGCRNARSSGPAGLPAAPSPDFSWALGYSCRVFCTGALTCFAQSLKLNQTSSSSVESSFRVPGSSWPASGSLALESPRLNFIS